MPSIELPGGTDRQRILVVEDEPLIAFMLSDIVAELGYHVVGPVGHFAPALKVALEADFNACIMDLMMDGDIALPLIEILDRRKVPFGYVTALRPADIDPRWRSRPFVMKPFGPPEIAELLVILLPPAEPKTPSRSP